MNQLLLNLLNDTQSNNNQGGRNDSRQYNPYFIDLSPNYHVLFTRNTFSIFLKYYSYNPKIYL